MLSARGINGVGDRIVTCPDDVYNSREALKTSNFKTFFQEVHQTEGAEPKKPKINKVENIVRN